MTISSALRAVGRMERGDHLCLAYVDADERRSVLFSYVRDGLAAEHKIVYLADQESPHVLPVCLRPRPARLETLPQAAGLDLAAALDDGRLVIRTVAEVYRGTRGFRPGETMGLLATETELALLQGHRGIRLTGEWPLLPPAPATGRPVDLAAEAEFLARRVAACERRVEPVLRGARIVAMMLCQYDRRRLPAPRLERMESHHHARARADDLYDDGSLRVTPLFSPPGLALTGTLDAATRPALDRVLRVLPPGAGLVCLDLSGLHSCDEEGLRRIVEAGRTSGGRQRQVLLRGVPPRLAGMLRATGLERAPGVSIGEPAH
ncbi:MEDS domain-containing protein [Actinomadura sp. NBRC 104412]|uniref:MEDS domain-containing protein n=1 Tax=Actinomadura sp. NBRC 104412 TaxID=3032203 RepID=UPI002556BB2C|nr:MEDS domain-containing protein [Actinomadura sp. NBRC 104412]